MKSDIKNGVSFKDAVGEILSVDGEQNMVDKLMDIQAMFGVGASETLSHRIQQIQLQL
jgi:hypothetical protein